MRAHVQLHAGRTRTPNPPAPIRSPFFLSRAWRNRRDIIRGLKVLVYRYGSRDYVDFSVRPIAYLYSHILLDFLHPLPPRCTDMAQVIMWVSVSDSLGILLVFLQI